ncbi:LysR substrate-binding domain-containing protein [Derxia gummosa]|uniref:LysR substrate-binding domain-containing protein n=1 Tax=Derxia gummosa DSM 723 TaxID=1121388 RepID=A0A8B6X7C1_9BURK|nr:LysR substrate-binding domain-containing protein [Derxia gummosa]
MARRTRPISLANLRGFEAAARLLSFTLAGEELHLTQSSMSRQIQALEEEIGRPLFVRRVRELELTLAGQKLHRVVRAALGELDRCVAEIRGEAERQRVSLTTWPSFASLWLVPRLSAFARLHPGIDLRIDSGDSVLDMVAEELDLAIRYCRDDQAPRNAIRLLDEELTPAISPALLERVGGLATPADLARCTLLVLDDGFQSSVENAWERWLELAGVPALQPAGRLLFNFVDQSMVAAVRGQGVVLGKSQFLRDYVERGELLMPFADVRLPSRYGVYLVVSDLAREGPAALFTDWLLAEAGAERGG